MALLVRWLLILLAYLPLSWLHSIGTIIGRLTYYASPRFAARINTNIKLYLNTENSQAYHNFAQQVARETGKGLIELSIAWCRSPAYMAQLVRYCTGWEHVERSIAQNHGIVFVTPHLGSYEIAGGYLCHSLPRPITAMYRPPKLAWLEPVMNVGRTRGKIKTVPATTAGVRGLIKALKSGEAIIILPDQVPNNREGVWAPFFGKPAYTMTLAAKLAQLKNVDIMLFVGERLPKNQGYAVHIEPIPYSFTGDKMNDTTHINKAMETLIRRYPTQYLWSYNRYKCPAGVTQPPNESSKPH